jgi:hypothetical protein
VLDGVLGGYYCGTGMDQSTCRVLSRNLEMVMCD